MQGRAHACSGSPAPPSAESVGLSIAAAAAACALGAALAAAAGVPSCGLGVTALLASAAASGGSAAAGRLAAAGPAVPAFRGAPLCLCFDMHRCQHTRDDIHCLHTASTVNKIWLARGATFSSGGVVGSKHQQWRGPSQCLTSAVAGSPRHST